MRQHHIFTNNSFLYLVRWLFLAFLIAILSGSASALFLFALEWATTTRISHRGLIWLLPVAGFTVGWLYLRFGSAVEGGNNLIIEEIHHPRQHIQLRMAPLVFCGTVISHLFGASVGREGSAVQMGASIADQFARLFRMSSDSRRIVLMTGISAGFSSVFGTPLAGAIFGLEVLSIGRINCNAILPCIFAAIVADRTGILWGVHHTHYAVSLMPSLTPRVLAAIVIAGGLFGLTAKVFANSTHAINAVMKKHIAYAPLRPFIGGIVVATAVMVSGGDRYIGLGIPVIVDALQHPLAPWDFACKLVYTVISLGTGFKGGEVTPLFYIGATLGNALAPLLHLPVGFLAALGFVALFAGAANTPIASTLMAIELFGAGIGISAALACAVAWLVSGYTGIYRSQRIDNIKCAAVPLGGTLATLPPRKRAPEAPSRPAVNSSEGENK